MVTPVKSVRKHTVDQTESFARDMRMEPTATEAKLFNALTKALERTTARAEMQFVVGPYIADIFIPYAKLIVEADGASHAGRKDYDERRENYMRRRGLRTVRFKNIEIWQDCDGVVAKVMEACGPLKPYTPGEVKVTYCPPRFASGHKRRLPLW